MNHKIDHQASFFTYFYSLQGIIAQDKSRWPQYHEEIAAKLALARRDHQLTPIVRRIIDMTDITAFLPATYSKFNVILQEGAVFMMCALSDQRLAEKLLDQIRLPLTATPGQRLFELIKDNQDLAAGRDPQPFPQGPKKFRKRHFLRDVSTISA